MTIYPFLTSNALFLQGKLLNDKETQNTNDLKYIVEGETISAGMAVVIGKLSITGKLLLSLYIKYEVKNDL